MKKLIPLSLLMLFGAMAFGQCKTQLKTDASGSLVPDYFNCANYANSPLPKRSCSADPARACYGDLECADLTNSDGSVSTCSGGVIAGTGLQKFVDGLPSIPTAVPDVVTYPGSDYYEIALQEYSYSMHRDLPPTKLRGYVQSNSGTNTANCGGDGQPACTAADNTVAPASISYLGPTIVARKNRPVRILFRNMLPAGEGGNLFIPVDTTVMGSGMGPNMMAMGEPDPRNPMCAMTPKPSGCFAENRATLHLHGGITPWISDGTPHQWITPADDTTAYPKGVSVTNVPDMPDPGPGAMTFFYTNQQSARLLFYHDHAWGITRLNVYAGEAAPYIITDDTEQRLVKDGVIPADQIPLVIQDKTFVPTPDQLAVEDPLWDLNKWGGLGNLWVPHVYMPAQNPGDPSGVNAFGRWAYGPWFWPPTSNIDYPPIANPYYDPGCDPATAGWCQPQLMPGTPYLSMGMESFHDTPVVNGKAYPVLEVEPKPYRLRILNAANDRFWNLQLYKADSTGVEVALNAAEVAAALADPNVFPTPDTSISTPGPNWIQIGTDAGFLPAPVVIPPQPITWVTDPTVFNAGNVDKHSLLLGPAERADVIVDFSQYAGQTLILYNDAPAAFPARDARYDYYTGHPDLTDIGGGPTTLPGYGPNTRTIMQIRVTGTAGSSFDPGRLQSEFAHHLDANGNPAGVFETSQNPIVVGQAEYNSAYGKNFKGSEGLVQIYDEYVSFNTVGGSQLRMPLQRKAIQDEMGEAFEQEYGRMSGNLGLETPNAQAGQQQNLILYPYINPPSEILKGVELPGLNVTPIASTDDGTQIWKITHNGVDTHPIHFHLFDVQLINRVGWDGIVRRPDANEVGWKDTVRISPLEDTIVALRPLVPKAPFGLPDSIRPLNPMMPIGNTDMFNNTDANNNPINPPISNQLFNFGWEYVWHCHILSHEEMDMMRPISVVVSRRTPPPPLASFSRDAGTGAVTLTWNDSTRYDDLNTWGDPGSEIGYRIERATVAKNGKVGTYSIIGQALANVTSYVDNTAVAGTNYSYRVVAYNAAGVARSAAVAGPAETVPAAPTNLVAALQSGPQISLTWRDNATNEAFFNLERAVDGGTFGLIAFPPARSSTGTVTFVDQGVFAGHTYQYRVAAVNSGGTSSYASSNTVGLTLPPAAPSGLTGSATLAKNNKSANVTLNWTDNSTDETGFTLERATNSSFTIGYSSTKLPANSTSVTQSGLYRGVTYYYRINSFNVGGTSVWSNVFTIVIP